MPPKQLLASIGSRLIDTQNFKSATNASTGVAAMLGTLAGVLMYVPDPSGTTQAVAGVLGLIAFGCAAYKQAQENNGGSHD